ncbi:hypothetical protein DL98DRAFT_597610 [Cadophora sp. DSE1049]|nr:hypothetical protein DL98DRAFT_597610 [Cadophora sp. DSE1049]
MISRKPAPKLASNLNKLQQISSSGTAATIAVANSNGSFKAGIQGPSTVYGGSYDENEDDDGDLPTIEELLLSKLQERGLAMEDRGIDKTRSYPSGPPQAPGPGTSLRHG